VSRPDIAVVGGGLAGRLLAWRASRAGLDVALYDAAGRLGDGAAAWVAAGMVTPAAEAVDADAEIVAMGRHSLTLWPRWLAELSHPVFYRDVGTLLFWHHSDAGEAHRFEALLRARDAEAELRRVHGARLGELEPALNLRFHEALYLPGEAQIDNRELLKAVADALDDLKVECHWNTRVSDAGLPDAGIIADCRGMGAKADWPQLRGVRGEVARLYAPEIELRHMLRLLHPRYVVYVVPRAEGRLVVGATSIESDDRSEVSVRGALELLSAAYSMLPALAEARILEFNTQVRPTLPDNRPALNYDRNRRILRINGLYRHGFLLSPAVVEEALALLSANERSGFTGRWSCLREIPAATRPDTRPGVEEGKYTCLSS
jgi:glycine oxidase